MQPLKILVIGASEVTLELRTAALPPYDGIGVGESYTRSPGGAGLIMAVAASRLGGDASERGVSVSLATKFGEDGEGDRLQKYLISQGVDTYFSRPEKTHPTPLSVNITEYGRSRRTLAFDGATTAFTAEDCKLSFAFGPDIILLNTSVPAPVIEAAAIMSRDYGIPLICDIEGSFASNFDISLLSYAAAVILDRAAAEKYSGLAPKEVDECLKIGMAISAKSGAGTIILRLGDRGSFIYDGLHYDFSAGREIYPIDESGSTECFAAAFAVKTAMGSSPREAAEYAAAAEALSMSRLGGAVSAPTDLEITRFIESRK